MRQGEAKLSAEFWGCLEQRKILLHRGCDRRSWLDIRSLRESWIVKHGHDVISAWQRFSRLEESVSVVKRTTTAPNTGRENDKAKAVRAITAETLGCGGCDPKGTVERLKGVWEVVRYFPPSVAQVSTFRWTVSEWRTNQRREGKTGQPTLRTDFAQSRVLRIVLLMPQ